jgi:hypothetical protein
MQSNAKKERDLTSIKTSFFFFFLSIKEKLTKDAKRNCRIHDSWPPPTMRGIFFLKCNSFFLKFKLKISQKCLETQKDKEIYTRGFLCNFINNLSLEPSQTTTNRGLWNSGRPEEPKVS